MNDFSAVTHTSTEIAAGMLAQITALLAGKQAKLLNNLVKNECNFIYVSLHELYIQSSWMLHEVVPLEKVEFQAIATKPYKLNT